MAKLHQPFSTQFFKCFCDKLRNWSESILWWKVVFSLCNLKPYQKSVTLTLYFSNCSFVCMTTRATFLNLIGWNFTYSFWKKWSTSQQLFWGELLQPPRSLSLPRLIRSLRSKMQHKFRIYYCINLLTRKTSPKVIKDRVTFPAPQVHPSSLLQLSESQVHTIELTSPWFSVLQCIPNTFLGSQRLMTATLSPVSIEKNIWIFA